MEEEEEHWRFHLVDQVVRAVLEVLVEVEECYQRENLKQWGWG